MAERTGYGVWPAAFLLAVFLTACGYHMVGSGSFPGGVQTIAVDLFKNRTSETGLETTVTNAIITELNRRRPGVVAAPGKADAILNGSIESLRRGTIAHRGTHTSLERRVSITVSLNLVKADGTVLWKGQRLNADQAYTVVEGSRSDTDRNLTQAIDLVTRRLAENTVRRLTADF